MRHKQYDPADLRKLYQAFDTAWSSIEHETTDRNREAVRDAVGKAIIGLAKVGHDDMAQLANYGAYQGRSFIDLRGA